MKNISYAIILENTLKIKQHGKGYSFLETSTQQLLLRFRSIVPKKGGHYGKYQFNINNAILDSIHN